MTKLQIYDNEFGFNVIEGPNQMTFAHDPELGVLVRKLCVYRHMVYTTDINHCFHKVSNDQHKDFIMRVEKVMFDKGFKVFNYYKQLEMMGRGI